MDRGVRIAFTVYIEIRVTNALHDATPTLLAASSLAGRVVSVFGGSERELNLDNLALSNYFPGYVLRGDISWLGLPLWFRIVSGIL